MEDNVFVSDDPEISCRLAQLCFSFSFALLDSDLEAARAIRTDAMLLKLSSELARRESREESWEVGRP